MTGFTARTFVAEGFGGNAAIDLVNSEQWDGLGRLTDHLDDPTWRAAFLAHWELVAMASAGSSLRAELGRLRTPLRRLVETVAAAQEVGDDHVATLNSFLASPVRRRVVRRDGGYRLDVVPVEPGWGWALAAIAVSAAELLASGQLHRLKVCANPDCHWAFVDETNGKTRRWCNDRACGNRDKVRRFRERRRGGTGRIPERSPPV